MKEEKDKTEENQKDNVNNTDKKEQKAEQSEKQTDEKEEKEADKKPKEPTCEEKLADANDKYLRLSAEFDNYRKRTAREKLDILRNGSEELIKGILPILDDFERSVAAIEKATDMNAVKEGVSLIQTKLLNYLKSQGLSEIETTDNTLDTDLHDAISKFPVDDESKKGKIIDVAQKGYKLNDKVIRYAKVIVGE